MMENSGFNFSSFIHLKMITSKQDWFLFIDGQQNSFRFLEKTFFSTINKSRTMNKSKR